MRPEFASLRNHADVSVLIVGGGINGIGLLAELALQGIDVLLVDKSDFCAGTSAAMTRIIHGGLRYLENAEFRLVRESLRERNRLLEKRAPLRQAAGHHDSDFQLDGRDRSGHPESAGMARQAGQSGSAAHQDRSDVVRLSGRPPIPAAAAPVPLPAGGPRRCGRL